MVAIPARNLLATANEVDLRADGLAPAHVMVYERAEGVAAYPTITSAGTDPLIGWAALSGLARPVEAGQAVCRQRLGAVGGADDLYHRRDADPGPDHRRWS
jgi:hypothetical protein